jgi:hypothetical protein
VFDLPQRGISTALAEGILALDFPEEDVARIEELNLKANAGQLTSDEKPSWKLTPISASSSPTGTPRRVSS